MRRKPRPVDELAQQALAFNGEMPPDEVAQQDRESFIACEFCVGRPR